MLEGKDESGPIRMPAGSAVTFAVAGREWLAYVEHDRKRRRSTVQDYRRELERVLIPEFGEETLLDQIGTDRIESYREKLVREGRLSARNARSKGFRRVD